MASVIYNFLKCHLLTKCHHDHIKLIYATAVCVGHANKNQAIAYWKIKYQINNFFQAHPKCFVPNLAKIPVPTHYGSGVNAKNVLCNYM